MKIVITVILLTAAGSTCACFPTYEKNRLQIDPERIHFVDSSTKNPIPEVLVIPQYALVESRSTPIKTRDDRYEFYVSDPFLFKKGKIARPLESTSAGVTWPPGCLFTGKEILMNGALVIALGYRPHWFSTSDIGVAAGKFPLDPIPEDEFAEAIESILTQLSAGTLRMPEECSRYYQKPCILEVRFKKKGHELVRSYLRRDGEQ